MSRTYITSTAVKNSNIVSLASEIQTEIIDFTEIGMIMAIQPSDFCLRIKLLFESKLNIAEQHTTPSGLRPVCCHIEGTLPKYCPFGLQGYWVSSRKA
ncbi:hypothetical protein [Pseudomonas hunanensis]|uniref:hypothetical protein n=1 Tax=Pseudomonas hunanensis TaxID=1247546 RepID=UPI0015BA15FD|nr:hypothetical protein [Pseudomonas hunanensis]